MDSVFEIYALVELMGHNKICGKVTEQRFGNQSMIRIDVPEIDVFDEYERDEL